MARLVPLAIAFLLGAANAAAPQSLATEPAASPQIRMEDSRLAALLADGVRRSPTLRSLVDRVEGGRVFVFVQAVRWLPGEAVGHLTWIGASLPNRFVRISIKTHARPNDLLASLAHELQHVVEVIGAPWVSDDQSLLALYRLIGHPTNGAQSSWDSDDARWMGDQVLRELKGLATGAAAAADER